MNPTNISNELAKERTREAAERTLTSWMQSCLALISFGFVYARLLPGGAIVGLGAIAAGVIVLAIVTVLHFRQIAALERGVVADSDTTLRVIATTAILIVFGIIALTATLLRP